ncbi:MAG: hypothetical protein E7641_07070 [Ruminococcaceae bacterium]|nr:hypothetical protein [Oscillospiraceae bacterium]
MKKIITLLLAVIMIAGSVLCISATDASPVKAYADANDRDLLYTVDFRGDSAFAPIAVGQATDYFDYTVSEDGSSLTVKVKPDLETVKPSYWGGTVTGLVANAETSYAMVYKVRANGNTGVDNSVGIGGWIDDGNVNFASFYNNYGNHNTIDAEGKTNNRRSVLSRGATKLGDYKMWATLKKEYNVDADNFVTMMLEYNGAKKRITSYILAKDGVETNQADWIRLEGQSMTFNQIDDAMGFMIFAKNKDVIDTTVKDVKIYKNTVYDPAAATTTTKATTTVAATTAAPATTAATTVAEEGGCGSALAISAIALLPAIGCAVVLKRRKED